MSDVKIQKYNAIKSKISSSSSYFDSTIDKLKKSGDNLAEGVILNAKAYDDGKLREYARQLSNILSDLKSISNICSRKIDAINAAKAVEEKSIISSGSSGENDDDYKSNNNSSGSSSNSEEKNKTSSDSSNGNSGVSGSNNNTSGSTSSSGAKNKKTLPVVTRVYD